MKVACISLTTDFGLSDPFVGIVKGVILSQAPNAKIVDLTHLIPPQGVHQAALALKQSAKYFPPHTLHVVIVDPGVGSSRDILLVRTSLVSFLAPDNGVLTYALEGLKIASIHQVNNPHYFLHPVSRTFHGRDIFAPVAGHLARGVSHALVGPPAAGMRLLSALPPLRREANLVRGLVLGTDHFGNLVTNIPERDLETEHVLSVHVKGRVLHGVSPSYSHVEVHDFGAIWGSSGHLEVFQRNGNASKALAASAGDEVVLYLEDPGK